VRRLDEAYAQAVGQAMLGDAPGEAVTIEVGSLRTRILVEQVGQDSAGL